QEFVATCFRVRMANEDMPVATAHLVNVLAHPPADRAIVDHRRAIIAELVASPDLRGALERLYKLLVRFRAQIEGATGAGKWDANHRQPDILHIAKEIFDCAAKDFVHARSGLGILAQFG